MTALKVPNNQTIRRLTLHWYAEYVMTNPIQSVNRNRHMNAFGYNMGEAVPGSGMPWNPAFNPKNKAKKAKAKIDDVRFLLADFLSRIDWTELAGIAKIDLLHLLTDSLKKFFKVLVDEHKDKLDADTCAALLVDYINFVGVRLGVDYGLYTRDITHETQDK